MKPASTRDRVFASAIRLLTNDGAAALTVRNVAQGAGCSTTGVYTAFGGKDGLVDAIFVEGFELFDSALDAADPDLYSLCRAYQSWARTHPTHYQVMFASAVPGYAPSDGALERAGGSFDRLVNRVSQADPETATPRQRAFHIWAVVHGYVMLEMLDMFPHDLGTVDELFELGVRQALGEPAP